LYLDVYDDCPLYPALDSSECKMQKSMIVFLKKKKINDCYFNIFMICYNELTIPTLNLLINDFFYKQSVLLIWVQGIH